MRVLLLHLVFTLPGELRTCPVVTVHFDDQNMTLLQMLDLTEAVHLPCISLTLRRETYYGLYLTVLGVRVDRFCNPYPFHQFIITSNINNNMQTQTSNTLHNEIMEAGSKDRPPMLAHGIDNDIYSTVDACPNACEMWKAIERLKQEWQRFVTLVKQSQELKNVSYHKLYDILKQHQHEVNEIRAEKIARVTNPLALVAQQQQVYHPQTHRT
nr:Gag-Pol polyprotein [Tanacetum cinerariifolium]